MTNGIESSYSYDDGGKDGEQNGWVNEYLVRKIKTEVDYQELDAAGLVKFFENRQGKRRKPKQSHPMMITDSQQQSRQQRKEP